MGRGVGVVVRGTGSCLPERVLTNDDFAATLDTSDEWIRTRTGIRERRIAAGHETAATLGLEASRRALAAADLSPTDIDLIVCASVTPETLVPSTACRIQATLGCRTIGAFDLLAACSGFLYALTVGDQFVRSGQCRHVLVVGTETLTRVLDFTDRNSCILFGDGAGAAVLSPSSDPKRGVRYTRLYADGSRPDLIYVPGVSARPQAQAAGCPAVPDFIRLNGREVFKFAVLQMVQLMREAMSDCDLTPAAIDLFIPHQVNQRIIDAALEQTGFPPEKVMLNLDRYGNTSAASVPIALDEAIRSGRAVPGDTVLLVAFGGGLTWSSAVLTL